jgi:hypothetical protein
MARAEVTQDDRYRPHAQGIEERERDSAAIGVDLGAQLVQSIAERDEGPFNVREQLLTVPGEPNRPTRPYEERDAEISLQPRDVAAQRGLGDAESGCGSGHVLLPRHDRELTNPGRHNG